MPFKNTVEHFLSRVLNDPTRRPPPAYTRERADFIIGEAFRRCFEYVKGVKVDGDILEFGTLRGYTARILATYKKEFNFPSGKLYLFDSFEGLPEHHSEVDRRSYEVFVNKRWKPGNMRVEQNTDTLIQKALTKIISPDELMIIKGYYENTLDTSLPSTKASIIHVDCDLYASAKFVLDKIIEKKLLQDGCLIIFDDYNCNRASPVMGERRAMMETFDAQNEFYASCFFSYGWHGHVFFIHQKITDPSEKPPE